jgi:serine/threonine-protein kinase
MVSDPREQTQKLGSPPAHSEVPVSIGGFPVVRVVGEGGMGRIYACRDEQLDRIVAIKVLRADIAQVPAMAQRFLREARAMARIHSPHVVTVHQVGEDHGVPFLVMELLEGEDLSERVIRKGPLGFAEAIHYAKDAVFGLQHAAEAGIIHRDVKPANLFLEQGHVKLTDFGLASPLDNGDARLTQEGLVVGTPHYLAPELARGGEATAVSDIYSLGATLYETLTGEPPYPGDAALDVVSSHLHKPVPSLKAKRRDTPDVVEKLIRKMMAKKAEQRFPSYEELVRTFDAVLQQLEPFTAGATNPHLGNAASSTPSTGTPASAPPRASNPALSRASGASVSVKTANLTVMFTDIAGYTERTGAQSREEAARWLELHDALLQPLIRAYRGKLVKTIGDAFLVTFTSPTDAVLCGTAIQDRLFQHNQQAASEDQIHVRVALSAGEVRMRKGDVLGEPVNLAARIESLAEPGQVLLSDAVYATMNVAEVQVSPIGEHTFKGIKRSVIVYRAEATGGPGQLPFGGFALSKAEEAGGALGDVAGKAAQAAQMMSGLGGRVRGMPLPAIGAAAGALVLAIALIWGLVQLFDDDMSKREAEKVLAELDAVPRSKRSASDEVTRGHALRVLGEDDDALKAYTRAVKRGETPEKGLELALDHMQYDKAGRAVAMVASWPNNDVEERMRAWLDDDWWPRHNALLVLSKRESLTDEERTKVGVRDLAEGDDCGRRRHGLLLLKRAGKGQAVLDAIAAAGERMPDNICMTLDLGSAEKAVRGRTE